MKKDRTKDQIRQIKEMMEKSTTFISLSGFSGVFTGICGLAAGYLLSVLFGGWILTVEGIHTLFVNHLFLKSFIFLMAETLVISVISAFIFTFLKAKKNKLALIDRTSFLFAFHFALPLLAGAVLILAFILRGSFEYILPSTLLFFGLALLNASKFTLKDIQAMGILEIAAGLSAFFFIEYSIILWTAGFGLLNMAYGIYMYVKYER